MSILLNRDQFAKAKIIELVIGECTKTLSKCEWKHCSAGYGYVIRETNAGDVLETIPYHVEVCTLLAEIAA